MITAIRIFRNLVFFAFFTLALMIQHASLCPWNWALYPYPRLLALYLGAGLAACIVDALCALEATIKIHTTDTNHAPRKPGIVPDWGKTK